MEWTRRKPFPPPPPPPQTPVRRSVNLIIVLLYYVTMPWQHLLSFQYKKEEEGESLFRSMSRSERWEREREREMGDPLPKGEKRNKYKKRLVLSWREAHLFLSFFTRQDTRRFLKMETAEAAAAEHRIRSNLLWNIRMFCLRLDLLISLTCTLQCSV